MTTKYREYKKLARETIGTVKPTRVISKNKKRYNRKRNKKIRDWEVQNG